MAKRNSVPVQTSEQGGGFDERLAELVKNQEELVRLVARQTERLQALELKLDGVEKTFAKRNYSAADIFKIKSPFGS